MKLYTSRFAPNGMRVEYFLKEKAIFDKIEIVQVELATEAKSETHLERNNFGLVPVLELADGRFLSESRAICSYIESQHAEPNLMGNDAIERAFIEMFDRQIEISLFFPIAHWIRHSHVGLLNLESPQVPDWAASAQNKARKAVALIDSQLAQKPFVAGDRYSIADITLYCALDFARLGKFRAWTEFEHINNWRERLLERSAFGLN